MDLINNIKNLDLDDLLEIANLIEDIEGSDLIRGNRSLWEKILDFLRKIPKEKNAKTKSKWFQEILNLLDKLDIPISDRLLIEDMEVLHSFLTEAQEHLEDIEGRIITMEESSDPEEVNDLFRSMHTIKGVSSFLGLKAIQDLSHNLENLLDKIRCKYILISPEVIDTLLAGTDLMNTLVGQLNYGVKDAPLEGRYEIQLDNHLTSPIVDKIHTLITQGSLRKEISQDAEDFNLESLITPEMTEKFIQETSEMLDSLERDLIELENSDSPLELVAESFRSIHTIKGNSGFFSYNTIERLAMDIEEILDSLRKEHRSIDKKVVSVLLTGVDGIRKALENLNDSDKSDKIDEYKPLGKILLEMGATTEDEIEDALKVQNKKLGDILVETGAAKEEDIRHALDKQVKRSETESAGRNIKKKDIRVDTEKLDKLFDLIGELITAEAMLIDNEDVLALKSESFQKASAYIGKITRELQEVTMAVRMIPLEGLFNRMKRLVRDLSHRFEKAIEFEISGQDTEMDRNIIEEISDPLVHLIRNAIDHGIEDSATRKRGNKPTQGQLKLNAKYEGTEIWITLTDDGQGLDRDKILAKAVDRELISKDQYYKDEEIWPLIFEPGFSTAKEVSEISGRGVGMDVVKKNIEKLRGSINIKSEEGKGASFILRIPLTLAILDGVSLSVGTRLYSIPIADVLEFQSIESDKLTKTDTHGEVINLRGELIPVIRLYDFYNISGAVEKIEEGVVIVITSNGKKAALLADQILGYKQIVLKALPEYMGEVKGLSGCSIMGDGDVSMILDVGSLYKEVLN